MKGIDLVIFQKNKKDGGRDFAKQTGYSVLVSDETYEGMMERGESVTLVDSRVPDVFYSGKVFPPREDRKQSGGGSKY